MREYPYLAIDSDGIAWECKTEPYDNGFGKWYTKEFFGSDDSIVRVHTFNEADYEKVFRADMKHKTQSLF